MGQAVIVSATQSPIGKAYRGALSDTSGPRLAAHALTGPHGHAGITGEEIHDIGSAEGNRPATSIAGLRPVLGTPAHPLIRAPRAARLRRTGGSAREDGGQPVGPWVIDRSTRLTSAEINSRPATNRWSKPTASRKSSSRS